ncbi:ABC transporter ATP-binding protein [Glaciibacter superstes]|uniref:ABC transporter ATP-binding protein n=1 Tax=Glaciibacter superstes TaxID=501023 RepID=UPI0003B37F8A|nr:ABC transporter ATP-binding protein [Glaciibacter superstes]
MDARQVPAPSWRRPSTDWRSDPPRGDVIVDVRNLHASFYTPDAEVKAVDDISFQAVRGRTLCIVGESGSGKSATARSLMQLIDYPGQISEGNILFSPGAGSAVQDIAAMEPTCEEIRAIRGRQISMIFQEPMSSLSPVHTIGNQISEVLEIHQGLKPRQTRERVIEELRRVGIPLPEERIDSYTFQLSGGMRQRAMIAMALIARPSLLIADEPTTALDVTTQAQILDLLAELKEQLGMSLIFITHDMGVVAEIADDVAVMRHGKIVEQGPVDQIFHDPQHDYTKQLLGSVQGGATSRNRRAKIERAAASPVVRERADPAITEVTERPLLSIRDLRMEFHTVAGGLFARRSKKKLEAVKGVSLDIAPGTTFGLVGESGCGKTTLGRCILRAYKPTSGQIFFDEAGREQVDLAALSERELKPYRARVRMVFQDPYGSLNPRMTVRQVVEEPLRMLDGVDSEERGERTAVMLERVGLKRSAMNRYPHAFSGGERQRIGMARALITDPSLVVADEAVSALDVSVRAQVLDLMAELQDQLSLTYLFISHDLSVVERICDDVAVMYFGDVVEQGAAEDVFERPQHPYTQALLSATPVTDPSARGTKGRLTYQP